MVGTQDSPPQIKQEPRRKKRRDVGTYACSSCPKVFTRSDHLARHYLNHQPKEVYVCDYVITSHKGLKRTCGKTFVRKDLRERHYRRHLIDKPDEHEPLENETNGRINDTARCSSSSDHATSANPHNQSPTPQYPGIQGPNAQETKPMVLETGNKNLPLQGPQQAPPTEHAPQVVPYANHLPANHLPANHLPANHHPANHHPANLVPGNQLHANHVPLNHAPANSGYQKPFQFQPPGQGQKSPLSQVYPQPFQMHFNHQQQYFPHGTPPMSMPLQHTREMPSHPNIPSGHQRFPNAAKAHAYAPEELDPLDPNTVNPHDLMCNYVPQPSNDILSWLFLESPESNRNDQYHVPIMGSTPASMTSDFNSGNGLPSPANPPYSNTRNMSFPENNPEPGVTQNFVDPMLNIGLQDLNYFSNNDNPLEEAFNPSPVNHNFKHVGRASVVSSSPTNTNESQTPKSISEKSQSELAKPSVKDRLTNHFHRVNLEHNSHLYVDESILKSWLETFTDVSRKSMQRVFQLKNETEGPFNLINRLSYYLHVYWEIFHPKFSILHRPSFDTRTAQPFLIFAMICVGAMYCTSPSEQVSDRKSSPEFKFCMLVAAPLRFKLFQHRDFKTPIKVWILQTLNLLEWSEKNYLSRHMHERAHIHHGTTVQLLRRSPFLGGNPENTQKHGNTSSADSGFSGSEEDNSDAGVSMEIDANEAIDSDSSLFEKWVESESMKRITFMTFYLDITDYIKFRHNPQIPFFQLQFLNLPCDDEKLWDCDEVNGSFKKLLKKQKSLQKPSSFGSSSRSLEGVRAGMNFLSALKRLIKPSRQNQSCRKLSMFTRAILFGGITSVMHQVQQAELQNSFTFLVSNARMKKNTFWKEVIVKALDYCEVQNDTVYNTHISSDPSLSVLKGQCRFSMYHLIHIIGLSDVNHYDIAIFGGSSQNMSVKATFKDYNIVKRKLTTLWQVSNKQTSDMSNYRSVIHCYWLLWGLMLKPMDANESGTVNVAKYVWSTDQDYYDIMYPISVSMLVLWCYTFTVCGAESSKFEDAGLDVQSADKMDLEQIKGLVAEGGYEYLYRIREEFRTHIQNEGFTSDYLLHTGKGNGRSVAPYEAVVVYCGLLQKITNKENISGLCLLVGNELLKSQWEIIRENAKLIINCGLRSLGKASIHCPDLFNDVD